MAQPYKTKWSNLTKEQKFLLSKIKEDELAKFLIEKCGFSQIIPTRDSIITKGKELNLILPDLMGIKNRKEYFVELKEKNRRMVFNDNGIDKSKFNSYMQVEKAFNIKVLIVFRDDEEEWKCMYPDVFSWFKDENGKCTYYGNWIEELSKTAETPINLTKGEGGTDVICFPLKNMKKIIDIFKERQTKFNFKMLE